MYKTLDVTLDTERKLEPQQTIEQFAVNTNDFDAIKFNVRLTQDKNAVNLSGATVKLAIRKPDKNVVYQNGSIVLVTQGQCEFDLETQSYNVPGAYVAEVMVYYDNGQILVSRAFSYYVLKGVLDDTAVESTSWYSDLETLRQSVEALSAEVDTVLSGAEEATLAANTAAQNAQDAADSTILIWQTPVDTFADIATTYPTPALGWTVFVRDTGKVFRYDGSAWSEIQDMDPTAINEVDSRLSSQLAETQTDLQGRGVSPLEFGVVGDGVTDDTANLQSYINDCQSNNKLMALNGTFAVTGITFGAGARVVGVATFNAINDNQAFVVQATSKINWVGKMTVDGKNKALKGFSGANFIASHFGEVETRNCKKWGFVFERSGNNNLVQVDYFRGTNNGKKHNSNYTVATSTVEGAYLVKRLTLATPLNVNDFTGVHDVIFVLYNGRPYKVKQVIDVSTIDVYNMPVAVSDTGVFDIIVGGSLNIQSYGDNGVGNWGVVDIYGTPGIAVNMSSLYGHTFGRLVLQGNSIGVGCSDISNGVVMHSPYFELNDADIVIWSYIDGTIYNPIVGLNKIYNLIQHNLFGIDYNPRLNIITDKKTPNMSEAPSTINSASRTLYPSNMYAFNYTTSPSARTFTIKNDLVYKNSHSAFLNLFMEVPGSLEITFALANANGETIEGGSTFTTTCNGDTHFLLFVNSANDWRVVKLQRDYDSVAIPSAGTYRTGDYVKKRVPVQAGTAGSRYVVKGWIRLTDGSAHVLGTDWVEDRALTGN